MKILIVEDDFVSRRYLRELLTYAGYKCETAKNASEGLDLYNKFKPDTILCDILMPGISGLEFLQKLRTKDKKIPVIMTTAKSSERMVVDALRLGANDYLRKPIQDSKLLPLLKQLDQNINNQPLENSYGTIEDGKITLKFKTEIDAPSRIVDRLIDEIDSSFDEQAKFDVSIGLSELVTNAIEHGNLNITYQEKVDVIQNNSLDELYHQRLADKTLSSRLVTVIYEFTKSQYSWTIIDEGNGFDRKSVPDPTSPEALMNLSGRGIYVSEKFFDSVEYIGKGNIVKVIKKKNIENSEANLH